MRFGNYVFYNQFLDNQRQMFRRLKNLLSIFPKILKPWERVFWQWDSDFLGISFGVSSHRPEQLLTEIQKAAYSTFELPGVRMDANGLYWTRFRLC